VALILCDGSAFLHVPRTGGTFVTAILKALGLVRYTVGHKHDPPIVIGQGTGIVYRCFVRDPLSWMRSVWAYQETVNWRRWPAIKDAWWHPFMPLNGTPRSVRASFEKFLVWTLDNRPGFVSLTFGKYVFWPGVQLMSFARLTDELTALCLSLGASKEQISGEMKICAGAKNASTVKASSVHAAVVERLEAEERFASSIALRLK